MAASTKTKSSPGSAQILDFSNVKEGGQSFNKKRVPAGDYLARITKVEDREAKDGVLQWLFTIQLENQYTDRKFPYYCKLQENQLWKIRNLCMAAGMSVPKKKLKLDPNRLVGKLIAVTCDDDEYEGKAQSNVSATFPASELEETADAETDEDYETDEDEDTDEEAEDDTATDDDTDDEEDEEEAEPAPPVKKAAAKKAVPSQRTKASTRKAVESVTDDELEELDLEDL